jgi:hypothetical protein
MDFSDILTHLLNFLAPALAVAGLVAIVTRILMPNRAAAQSLWTQVAINFIVGAVALAVGLWSFGRDGKMASYAALVVCCASCQWFLQKGWKA